MYLARTLGAESFGELGVLLTIYSYFAIVANPGFDTIALRDVAQSPTDLSTLIPSLFFLRFTFSFLAAFLFINLFKVITTAHLPFLMIIFQCLNLFLIPFSLEFLMRGWQKMNYVAALKILNAILLLCLSILFIHSSNDFLIIPLLYLFPSLIGILLLVGLSYKNLLHQKYIWNFTAIKNLMKDALPIGLSSLMVLVYYNVDMVLIWLYRTSYEVGLYNSAYKIFYAFSIFSTFMGALLPTLAKLWVEDKNKFYLQLFAVSKYIYVIASALIAISFMATPIMSITFGIQYVEGARALSWLLVAQSVIWFFAPFGYPLTVMNKTKIILVATTIGAVFNLLANIIIIPHYGIEGAAIVTLLSEVVVGMIQFLYFYYNKKLLVFHIAYMPKESLVFILVNVLLGLGYSLFPVHLIVYVLFIVIVNIALMIKYHYFNKAYFV